MSKYSEISLGMAIILISLLYACFINALTPNAPWGFFYLSYSEPILSLAAIIAIINIALLVLRFAYLSKFAKSPVQYLLRTFIKYGAVGVFKISWPVVVIIIMVPAFNIFKQGVLPSAGYKFDNLFAAVDSSIFGVASPGLWLVETLNSPHISLFIDKIYHAWFFPMALGVVLVAYCSSSILRVRYMLTFVLTWIVMATLMAYLLPAAGPFHGPLIEGGSDDFNSLFKLLSMHQKSVGEIYALTYQEYLFKSEGSAEFVMGGGISAMPSMHNAFSLLFALGMWMYSKAIGVVFFMYALAVLLGSVYLGWHYAIDGLIGWLVVSLLWLYSGWVLRRLLV